MGRLYTGTNHALVNRFKKKMEKLRVPTKNAGGGRGGGGGGGGWGGGGTVIAHVRGTK